MKHSMTTIVGPGSVRAPGGPRYGGRGGATPQTLAFQHEKLAELGEAPKRSPAVTLIAETQHVNVEARVRRVAGPSSAAQTSRALRARPPDFFERLRSRGRGMQCSKWTPGRRGVPPGTSQLSEFSRPRPAEPFAYLRLGD